MLTRQRAAGDYLQPSAILDFAGGDLVARNALNDPHHYLGPGTGYRAEGRRLREITSLPHVEDPRTVGRRGVAERVLRRRAPPGPETVPRWWWGWGPPSVRPWGRPWPASPTARSFGRLIDLPRSEPG
jgi:hypothetical protein